MKPMPKEAATASVGPGAKRAQVTAFAGFVRTVADLQRSVDFYAEGLGFEPGPSEIMEVEGDCGAVTAHRVRLTLGDEAIELAAPLHTGGPVMAPGDAGRWNARDGDSVSSTTFQHLAIVASDIDAAIERLRRFSPTLISAGGAVQLPASAGGVTAFKFRDPDGHPLELIFFPAGAGDPKWQGHDRLAPTLGIDHSAISISNVERSLAFYCDGLGFKLSARQVNRGSEQDRLDGAAPVVVDVVSLSPGDARTPHLELLGYRTPAPVRHCVFPPLVPLVLDRSDRLRWYARDVQAIGSRITAAASVSPADASGAQRLGSDTSLLLRDPDGHVMELTQARPPRNGRFV